MSSIRDAIRDASRLSRMRMGQQAWEFIEFPSLKGKDGTPIRFAQVPLLESETQQGVMAAANVEVADNFAGMTVRNRVAMVSDAWHSLRDPADISVKAFESIEEMTNSLEPTEIDMAVDQLATMMDYSSPSLDGISKEALDDLKAACAQMDLSDLSGRRWAVVKLFFQTLQPELLQAKLSGSTSTESSTTTSGDGTSTSSASES